MFNVSAIQRLRLEHNLTAEGSDETEVSSLLQARGMDTGRLWRETMHTRRGMIKEASCSTLYFRTFNIAQHDFMKALSVFSFKDGKEVGYSL